MYEDVTGPTFSKYNLLGQWENINFLSPFKKEFLLKERQFNCDA